jgi:hypothetical protein
LCKRDHAKESFREVFQARGDSAMRKVYNTFCVAIVVTSLKIPYTGTIKTLNYGASTKIVNPINRKFKLALVFLESFV